MSDHMLVKEILRTNIDCVKPDDSASKARSIIRDSKVRILPVCDAGRLIGILSRGDVLKVTSTKTNLTIDGIMNSNVITISSDEDVMAAAEKIMNSKILYLPVVDGQEFKGIISSRDVLKHVIENRKPSKKTLESIMTTSVITCSPEDELSKIWDKMMESGLGGLPVVEKKMVKGMITKIDLLSKGSARIQKESGKGRKVLVKKVMKSPPITLNSRKNVGDAASLMVSRSVTKLPVVDDKNQLVGIVDVEDVFKAYLS
ncbi:MAG: CBS domain-containing protein [Candidatus Altiarchaeota archaeon]